MFDCVRLKTMHNLHPQHNAAAMPCRLYSSPVMTALTSFTPLSEASVRSMRSRMPLVRSAPSRMAFLAYAWDNDCA